MKDGWRPLHTAASGGHVEVVGCLIQAKANPQAVTDSGDTAYSLAESRVHPEVAWLLRSATEEEEDDSLPDEQVTINLGNNRNVLAANQMSNNPDAFVVD